MLKQLKKKNLASGLGTWDESWDLTDPGLYRSKKPMANYLMVFHLVGGAILMIAGPFQLIYDVRKRNWLNVHRYVGRLYIVSALITSMGGTLFVIRYGSARNSLLENVANLKFGVSMMISAARPRHGTARAARASPSQ